MKAYEMMIENLNKCPGNQMRDTEIREIETDDLDAYVNGLHKDKKVDFIMANHPYRKPRKG